MADPLSICTGIITLATLAYQSGKALHDLIGTIKDAPKTVQDLCADLETLQLSLKSLKTELEGQGRPHELSKGQLAVLQELDSPLRSCSDVCQEFEARMGKLLSHTTDGRTSFRDSVKLHFYEKEIAAVRFRLSSYKGTLTVALNLATLKTATRSNSAIAALEEQLQETRQLLSGQMQGMLMGVQDIIATGDQVQTVIQRTDAQIANLAQCLALCMTAWSECNRVNTSSGVNAKYVRALDDSRQLLGNIGDVGSGGPEVKIDVLITQHRAKFIGGNIEGKVALDFMNAPYAPNVGGGSSRDIDLPLPPIPS